MGFDDDEDYGLFKQAMQTRCPWCLGEQYAPNLIDFSNGNVPCGKCGEKTVKMTYQEWYIALGKAPRLPGERGNT